MVAEGGMPGGQAVKAPAKPAVTKKAKDESEDDDESDDEDESDEEEEEKKPDPKKKAGKSAQAEVALSSQIVYILHPLCWVQMLILESVFSPRHLRKRAQKAAKLCL